MPQFKKRSFMKKILFFILLLSSCLFAQNNLKIINNYNEAIKLAKAQGKPVMMLVYADFCPWCTKMKERTLYKKKVSEFINKNYIFVQQKRDQDLKPNNKFYSRFIPTIYVINPNSQEELFALYGYKNQFQFMKEVNEFKEFQE